MVIGASPSDVVTSDAADDELNDDDMDDDEFDMDDEEATRASPIILERRDAPRRINDEDKAMADDMLCYALRRSPGTGCSPALRGRQVNGAQTTPGVGGLMATTLPGYLNLRLALHGAVPVRKNNPQGGPRNQTSGWHLGRGGTLFPL